MLNRDSLAKQVYTKLKDIIILQETKGFQMGDQLSESHIAHMFGCSVTPVRESLNMLRRDGLVVGTSYRSSSVVIFREKDVNELFELRSCLELFAFEKSIPVLTSDDVQDLIESLKAYESAYVSFEQTKIVESNQNFHNILISKVDNHMLIEEIEKLSQRIAMVRAPIAQQRKREGDLELLLTPVREHKRIITALQEGKSEEALAALKEHLARVCSDSKKCYRH